MTMFVNQLECEAILFDLDGVLIDSSTCITRHWAEWAAQHDLDLQKIMQIAHGMRTIETIRAIAQHLDAEKETIEFTASEIADTDGVVAIEGAIHVLSGLLPGAWTIVTSGSLDLVKARLIRARLPIPIVLVTADDVRNGKPSPEPYLVGAKRLGLDVEKCVVVEDAPAGVEAGKKAGMRVIGITSTHNRDELLAKGADVIIDHLGDLKIEHF
jgi:mannitol-1-/sugar-/sorbitol-6-phosphatase